MIDNVLYAKLVFPLEKTKEISVISEGMHVVGLEEPVSPELELLQGAISTLKAYKDKYGEQIFELGSARVRDICHSIPEREEHINTILGDIPDLKSQIKELSAWEGLLKYTALRELGYSVKFCLIPGKEKPDIPYTYHRMGNHVAVLSTGSIKLSDDLVEIEIRGELETYHHEMEELKGVLAELQAEMVEESKTIPALKKAEKIMKYNLNLKSFMSVVKERGRLGEIEVFFPSSEKEHYLSLLDGHAGVYIRNPEEDDTTPILLKNSWLASLFEILTKQGSVPKYNVDIDPTPLLMIPFWVFFSLCMPDIGYGILILGGVFGAVHILKKRKIPVSDDVQRVINLVMILGIGSFIAGILSASFFGFSMVSSPMLTPDNIMGIGMWLGVAQLIFGLLLKAYVSWNGRTEWKIGADMGWLMAYIGVVLWFSGMSPYGLIYYGAIFAVIIEGLEPYKGKFSVMGALTYMGNWVGASLWNTFNRASGLFSDTISYVRIPVLFLVAVVLGNVVVELGKSIGGLFGVCVVVFGNLFVFLLSIMGAIAHPARLQLIEFRHQFETCDEKASFYKPFNR